MWGRGQEKKQERRQAGPGSKNGSRGSASEEGKHQDGVTWVEGKGRVAGIGIRMLGQGHDQQKGAGLEAEGTGVEA